MTNISITKICQIARERPSTDAINRTRLCQYASHTLGRITIGHRGPSCKMAVRIFHGFRAYWATTLRIHPCDRTLAYLSCVFISQKKCARSEIRNRKLISAGVSTICLAGAGISTICVAGFAGFGNLNGLCGDGTRSNSSFNRPENL